ncbi:MAG: hypothetical protein RIF32_02605, partial [Leptospirales bacterium]
MRKGNGWILGNFGRDAGLILFPGMFAVLLSYFGDEEEGSGLHFAYMILILAIIDNGHVYSTLWRTLFRKSERRAHAIYWAAPLLVSVGMFLWIQSGSPYFWALIFYAAWFHHLRQYYGISRWYQKLNGRFCAWTNRFLYALLVLPFVLFHLRGAPDWFFRSRGEYFAVDWPEAFWIGLFAYIVLGVSWLIFELSLIVRGLREWNRLLSVFAPGVLYGICLLLGDSLEEVFFPMLMAHGAQYLAIIALSLRRLEPERYRGYAGVVTAIVAVVLVAGFMEFLVEDNYLID